VTTTLWVRVVCVAAGGAAGALCRWGASATVARLFVDTRGAAWHLGTLAVNVSGCFLFGWGFAYFATLRDRFPPSIEPAQIDAWQLALLTGFLSAFTTFSAFAFDTQDIFQRSGFVAASINIFAHAALGWAALLAGMAIVRGG
jgi:CrcB protein